MILLQYISIASASIVVGFVWGFPAAAFTACALLAFNFAVLQFEMARIAARHSFLTRKQREEMLVKTEGK